MMDDARLMYVIMTALNTTENVIKKRDDDPNWVFGVMVTPPEIEEAKEIIGERFTAGISLTGSASVLEKTAAYALGVIESAQDSWNTRETVPPEALDAAAKLLRRVLWPSKEEKA